MRILLFGIFMLALNVQGETMKEQDSYLAYGKDVQISFCFSPEEGSQNPQAITVTYTNISKQKGILRLPIPFYANREFPDCSKYPLLVLLLKNSKEQELGFGFTLGVKNEITDTSKDKKEVSLQPGEKHSETYLLSDFWMRGSCDVNTEGCFSKVIEIKQDAKPHKTRIGLMLYTGYWYSNEITIKCSYPDWIFPDWLPTSQKTEK